MLSVIWGGNRREGQKKRFGASASKVGYHLYQTCRCLSVIYIYCSEKWIHAASKPKFAIHFLCTRLECTRINCDQIYQAHKGWHISTGVCCLDDGAIRKQALRKSRGKVLRGYSISRQAITVCKVKISGS